MGYISGEAASINGIPCLRKWKIAHVNIPATGYCSNSLGRLVGVPGNDDWHGVAVAYGGNPPVLPGRNFAFVGSSRDGSGATGLAIVNKIDIVWDVEGGNLLYYLIDFSGVGELTMGTGTAAAPSGTPAPVSCKGLSAFLGATETAIRSARLTVECDNPDYNDSATAGHTSRLRGNIKADFSMGVYCNDFGDLPAQGSISAVSFEVAAAGAVWLLNYGLITAVTPNVPIEGTPKPELISADINGIWTAYNGTIDGTITSPTGVVLSTYVTGT